MSDFTHSHRRVWEAIPWIVNHTASEVDVRSVQEHVCECADCREALAFEERLCDVMTSPQASLSEAERGWRKLGARIEGNPVVRRAPEDGLPRVRPAVTMSLPMRWLAAAVVVEALTLGAIVSSSWLERSGRAPIYRTLSQPAAAAAAPTIRVVLSPTMTLEQLRVLLNGAHLQVVAGPSEAGVWSLAPVADATSMATDAALRELRASPQVRFAEPIVGATDARAPPH